MGTLIDPSGLAVCGGGDNNDDSRSLELCGLHHKACANPINQQVRYRQKRRSRVISVAAAVAAVVSYSYLNATIRAEQFYHIKCAEDSQVTRRIELGLLGENVPLCAVKGSHVGAIRHEWISCLVGAEGS